MHRFPLCAFTKIRGDVFYFSLLWGNYLQLHVKSGILYPNGVSWIQGRLSARLQSRARRPVPESLLSSFTFLSFTLPARKGNSGGPPARAAVLFALNLVILHENTSFALAKMSSLQLAQPVESVYNTGRAGFPAAPSAPAGRMPACTRGRKGLFQAPAYQKINRVRLCALSAASTGSSRGAQPASRCCMDLGAGRGYGCGPM